MVGACAAVFSYSPPELRKGHDSDLVGLAHPLKVVVESCDAFVEHLEQRAVVAGLVRVCVEPDKANVEHPRPQVGGYHLRDQLETFREGIVTVLNARLV